MRRSTPIMSMQMMFTASQNLVVVFGAAEASTHSAVAGDVLYRSSLVLWVLHERVPVGRGRDSVHGGWRR
jgi:hypothetical protein